MAVPGAWAKRVLALVGVGVLVLFPLGAALSGVSTATGLSVERALFQSGPTHGAVSSTNWAGYAVTGSSGSVSFVKASWTVPKVQGSCPSSKNEYSAFWVGIDGYSSKTVEQTGTDSDCQGGSPTYYAWYEFYPAASNLISKIKVKPGNVMVAQVKFAAGKFNATITDLNTSVSASHTKAVKGAARSSAEWIAEAPSSSSGILPLADFGTARFGYDATGAASTGEATVSGSTGSIGSFATATSLTMVTQSGSLTKASVSALTPDGSSFNVTWVRTGP